MFFVLTKLAKTKKKTCFGIHPPLWENVKNDIKELMKPLVDMIIQQLYPYIFLSIIFVSIFIFTVSMKIVKIKMGLKMQTTFKLAEIDD